MSTDTEIQIQRPTIGRTVLCWPRPRPGYDTGLAPSWDSAVPGVIVGALEDRETILVGVRLLSEVHAEAVWWHYSQAPAYERWTYPPVCRETVPLSRLTGPTPR